MGNKLPQFDYNIQVQGPPNAPQAFGAIAGALSTYQDIVNDSMMEVAKEQAKAQSSIAKSVLESGLGQVETALLNKPYLTKREVLAGFGDQTIPPHVQAALDQNPDAPDDEPVIPTGMVGADIHAASAKALAKEAGQEIWAKQVRSEFEQNALLDSTHRRVALDRHLAQQHAQALAINQEVAFDREAEYAWTPKARGQLTSRMWASGVISETRKAQIQGEWDKKWAADNQRRESARLVEETFDPKAEDGGAAQLEEKLKGIDPLIAEDARQRQAQRFTQVKQLRMVQDSAPLARLDAKIYAPGHYFSPLDPDYLALSDEGKATAQHHANAERRAAKSSSAEDRRIQADEDRNADALFKSLPTKEQATIDVNKDKRFDSATQRQRDILTGYQKKAVKEVNKDNGVEIEQYRTQIAQLAQNLGYSKERADKFQKYLVDKFTTWRTEHNQEPYPTVEAKREMADAILYGEAPGSLLHMAPNEYKWQAAVGNREFAPFPDTDSDITRKVATLRAGLIAQPPPEAPAEGTIVPGEALGLLGGEYKRVGTRWQRVK